MGYLGFIYVVGVAAYLVITYKDIIETEVEFKYHALFVTEALFWPVALLLFFVMSIVYLIQALYIEYFRKPK